jgi:hypothetical protein
MWVTFRKLRTCQKQQYEGVIINDYQLFYVFVVHSSFAKACILGNSTKFKTDICYLNPLNAELNPICHLLALLGAHHILHVSGIRVNVNVDFAQGPCAEIHLCNGTLINNADCDDPPQIA